MPPQTCTTSFLAAAQSTPGLDFLVQAIQRGNLQSVLPAAGSGATVFAPNNAAFTNMLQTLSALTLLLHTSQLVYVISLYHIYLCYCLSDEHSGLYPLCSCLGDEDSSLYLFCALVWRLRPASPH